MHPLFQFVPFIVAVASELSDDSDGAQEFRDEFEDEIPRPVSARGPGEKPASFAKQAGQCYCNHL